MKTLQNFLHISIISTPAQDLLLNPELEFKKYTLGLSPEPRLGIKYNLSDKIRLKLATGLYSQNILSTTSDQDVVNLFTELYHLLKKFQIEKMEVYININFKKLNI